MRITREYLIKRQESLNRGWGFDECQGYVQVPNIAFSYAKANKITEKEALSKAYMAYGEFSALESLIRQ